MNRDELINELISLAAAHNYRHIRTQEWVINFERYKNSERTAINVYWNKYTLSAHKPSFTVQTALNHPKLGKTQLNRKLITLKELGMIFENPRIHTKKGYMKRSE